MNSWVLCCFYECNSANLQLIFIEQLDLILNLGIATKRRFRCDCSSWLVFSHPLFHQMDFVSTIKHVCFNAVLFLNKQSTLISFEKLQRVFQHVHVYSNVHKTSKLFSSWMSIFWHCSLVWYEYCYCKRLLDFEGTVIICRILHFKLCKNMFLYENVSHVSSVALGLLACELTHFLPVIFRGLPCFLLLVDLSTTWLLPVVVMF